MRIALEKVRRIETAIALAEKMSQPDWSLGLGYFRGIRVSDRPTGSRSVLPRDFGPGPPGARNFWFGQKEAFLREARARREVLLESLAAEQRNAEYLVRSELFAQDTAGRKLRLHRDVLLTQARQAYEDTLAAYQSERASFAEVIDALRQWLRFDLEGTLLDATTWRHTYAWRLRWEGRSALDVGDREVAKAVRSGGDGPARSAAAGSIGRRGDFPLAGAIW